MNDLLSSNYSKLRPHTRAHTHTHHPIPNQSTSVAKSSSKNSSIKSRLTAVVDSLRPSTLRLMLSNLSLF